MKLLRIMKQPMKEKAGFLVLRSNFFDTAIMKMSVVSEEFKKDIYQIVNTLCSLLPEQ